jgi:hypothetical protein
MGACCFRVREAGWALQWIWLHPYFRDHGYLTAAWDAFRALFGGLYVEPPLSSAMAGFLKARQSSLCEDLCVVKPLNGEPNAYAVRWRPYLAEGLGHPRFKVRFAGQPKVSDDQTFGEREAMKKAYPGNPFCCPFAFVLAWTRILPARVVRRQRQARTS